jgi:hypothetical protein
MRFFDKENHIAGVERVAVGNDGIASDDDKLNAMGL